MPVFSTERQSRVYFYITITSLHDYATKYGSLITDSTIGNQCIGKDLMCQINIRMRFIIDNSVFTIIDTALLLFPITFYIPFYSILYITKDCYWGL